MFQSVLENLINEVDGARWVIVVGLDGVLLEASIRREPETSIEALAAEYALFLKACKRVLAETGSVASLDNFTLCTDVSKVVLQSLTPEYFIVMGLDDSSLAGQARHRISRIQPKLERQITT